MGPHHGAADSQKTASFSYLIDFIIIMDKESKLIRFDINQLAGITGLYKQTISGRLKNAEPAP